MTRQIHLPKALFLVVACLFGLLQFAPATRALELSAIPIPAALRPPLSAACQAWGKHVKALIDQHRIAGEVSDEELQTALGQFYAAEAYCSMGCILESLATYEKISLERIKRRPIW